MSINKNNCILYPRIKKCHLQKDQKIKTLRISYAQGIHTKKEKKIPEKLNNTYGTHMDRNSINWKDQYFKDFTFTQFDK